MRGRSSWTRSLTAAAAGAELSELQSSLSDAARDHSRSHKELSCAHIAEPVTEQEHFTAIFFSGARESHEPTVASGPVAMPTPHATSPSNSSTPNTGLRRHRALHQLREVSHSADRERRGWLAPDSWHREITDTETAFSPFLFPLSARFRDCAWTATRRGGCAAGGSAGHVEPASGLPAVGGGGVAVLPATVAAGGAPAHRRGGVEGRAGQQQQGAARRKIFQLTMVPPASVLCAALLTPFLLLNCLLAYLSLLY